MAKQIAKFGVERFLSQMLNQAMMRLAYMGKAASALWRAMKLMENISDKEGLSEEELMLLVDSDAFGELDHVRIRGLMGMATYTENSDQIREEFRHLLRIFDRLKAECFSGQASFDQLSCGMSGDYALAIEEGSNLVRIGSLIFGPRNYSN